MVNACHEKVMFELFGKTNRITLLKYYGNIFRWRPFWILFNEKNHQGCESGTRWIIDLDP